MRKKIVIWGTNEKDEKVLIAIALNSEENKLDIYVFPEAVATEAFYNTMIHDWREHKEVSFPEDHQHIEKPLSSSESILPDNLKADKPDIIHRAQKEWPFLVLAEKLYKLYREELDDLKDKVENLSEFSGDIWEELQQFWNKVQEQARSRMLSYAHIKELREETNELFSVMKELRKKIDAELRETSKKIKKEIEDVLHRIDEKISKGLSLKILFEDLKKIQAKVKESAGLIRSDRNTLWKHIDKRFKSIKEKRFGPEGEDSKLKRLERRLDGLHHALDRLNHSVKRDEKEIAFQKDRISNAANQLEAQIREAKLIMLGDRIKSKKEKIAEMMEIKTGLEISIEKEHRRIENKKQREESKKAAKEKLKLELEKSKKLVEEEGDKLKEAVEKIKSAKKEKKSSEQKKTSITKDALSAAGAALGESLEDVVDTIKSVASVLGQHSDSIVDELKDKAGDIIEDISEETSEFIEAIKDKVEDIKEQWKEEERTNAATQASGKAEKEQE